MNKPAPMALPAFTLLELLLVITIIGILSATIVLDFSGVKQRQELALIADQTVAMMQQARGEVNGGKVRHEVSETNSDIVTFLCEGAYFEEGQGPLFLRGDYGSDACGNFETEAYGTPVGGAFTDNITVGGIAVSKLWALYSPPDGKIVFYDENGGQLTGDAVVHFANNNPIDLDLSVTISPVSNLATLSLGTDEK